jgi:hypothetical protein
MNIDKKCKFSDSFPKAAKLIPTKIQAGFPSFQRKITPVKNKKKIYQLQSKD